MLQRVVQLRPGHVQSGDLPRFPGGELAIMLGPIGFHEDEDEVRSDQGCFLPPVEGELVVEPGGKRSTLRELQARP